MAAHGRRRTKALLPFATVTGSAPVFDRDWSAIETAYRHELNGEVRSVIAGIVMHYLDRKRFEEEAQALDDVVGWAAGVERGARALQKGLAAAGGNDARERLLDAVKIAAHPKHPFHGAVEQMQSFLFWFARHVRAEIAEFKKDSAGAGFKDGAAWDEMIRTLTAELGSRGLPTRVANTSRAKNPKASDFLKLIKALDVCGYRFSNSDDALAKAINKARRCGN